MITLGESTTVATGLDSSFDLLPCVQLLPSNRLLVTEGSHLAAVYDLSSSIPLKSWTFPGRTPLTAPVIYDQSADQFVSIQQKKSMKLFGIDDEIEEVIATTLNQPAACVLSSSRSKPVVVYESGHFEVVTEKYQPFAGKEATQVLKKSEKIVSAQVDNSSDHSLLYVLTKDENSLRIYVNFVKEDSEPSPLSFSCTLKSDFIKISTFFNQCCLGLTPDGKLFRVKTGNEEKALQFPDNYRGSILDLLHLNNEVVVVTKLSESLSHTLEIWNLKYGVQISDLSLELTPLEKCLTAVDDHILVACSKGVVVIPYRVVKPSLASIIGKAANRENSENQSDEMHLLSILHEMSVSAPKATSLLQIKALRIAAGWTDEATGKERDILQEILSRPFIYHFVVNQLREISFSVEEIVRVIDVIRSFFSVQCLYLIDWICAFLDSYMKRLILGSNDKLIDSLKALTKWNDRLEEFCEDLDIINTYIGRIERKLEQTSGKPRYTSKLYCIEYLQWE